MWSRWYVFQNCRAKQVKDTGLQLLGAAQLSFVKIGTIHAHFQSAGKEHWCNDACMIKKKPTVQFSDSLRICSDIHYLPQISPALLEEYLKARQHIKM